MHGGDHRVAIIQCSIASLRSANTPSTLPGVLDDKHFINGCSEFPLHMVPLLGSLQDRVYLYCAYLWLPTSWDVSGVSENPQD